MDKFWSTFKLTYKNKVTTKSFQIFTIIVIVLILAAANINKIIDLFDHGSDKVGIVTDNKQIYKLIDQQSKQLDDDAQYVKVTEQTAKSEIKKDKLDKAYVITISDDQKIKGKIMSKDSVSTDDKQQLSVVLSTIQTQLTAANLNLSANELKQLQAQSKVTSEVVDNTNAKSDLTEAQKGFNMIIVYAGVMLMFFIVINYAGQVAMEIATEKTSRVIEMIITSVSPVTHILAKIFGVIAVALTQIAIFFIVGLISFFVFDIRKMLKGFKIEPNDLTAQLITVGIISLLLGILSYIILAAILGSITARIEDINQALMPMTLLSMIGFYIALFSVMNPDTLLVKIASFIPLISPFVMFVRAATPEVALWEIIVSIILSVVTIIILLWIAVRSYKDTILSFDKGFIQAFKRIANKR
ncbi:ABC transporter permease [Staphylococcus gallinarum]|uniref:ABC transporter permease n=1 Tax=Staphylococcus gallinarum TaxID=1293 RepID=UPI000D1D08AF|nr:ABC transporter permease [Staphylococcus gallinarum]MBU7217097.1 ABC transporter permease [Staphylococcus gallinarum]MCD8792686.1 ABC transporter permease [Staphylococcus gallinarum]MCD8918560.1 ABC transporter permease [Staphylococcus gallinarum]PTE33248.1 ABC transporter permease [Staphylococcus gallinarum]PTK89413.1 ABC transporter permease [Staphylococcus gallinarum]